MATKGALNIDSTGSLSLAQLPPQISLTSPLLASIIHLPSDPVIAYTIFEPSDSLDPSLHLSAIESARRSLVSNSRSVLKSLLFTVKILPHPPLLYIFAISSSGQPSPAHDALLNLKFDGLASSKSSAFSLKGLYPCSSACSIANDPCSGCLTTQLDGLDPSEPPFLPRPLVRQLPRSPLRTIYAQLLHSIREFVSDRLGSMTGSSDLLPTFRCQDGVVLLGTDGSSDWGNGWVHRSRNRRLVFCRFEIHLSPCCLLLHPVLHPVDLLPLARSVGITPGSPIKLLPFNTPAYYIGPYTSPTGALTARFDDSLRGLGVSGWKDLFHKPTGKHLEGPSYVIAWVAVQNKRGEEKGISIVWPLSLCLAFSPEALQTRQSPLPLPELPTSLRLHSSIPPLSSTTTNVPLISPQDIKPTFTAIPIIPPIGLSPHFAAYSAYSVLSLPSYTETTAEGVSREVSRFVDYVAKERERERERIKKERESHSNSTSFSQPAVVHTSHLERERTPSPSQAMGSIASGSQEIDKPPSAETCGLLDSLDANSEASVQDTPARSEKSPDVTGPFEIYPNFDPPWAQGNDQFPALEIDYEIGFGIEMNTMGRGAGIRDEAGAATDLDDICGVFTDDDFNFFDRPTLDENYLERAPSVGLFCDPFVPRYGSIPPTTIPTSSPNRGVMHHEHMAGYQRPISLSPPPLSSTPRVDPITQADPMECVSSPSVSSRSTPSTPQVIPDVRNPSSAYGSSMFDPVWFSPTCRTSDHKYASGKFSLPNQQTVRVSGAAERSNGWRFQYDDVTDPRKSVVRMLAGPPPFDGNETRGEDTGDTCGGIPGGESESFSDAESIDEGSVGSTEAVDISALLDRSCTPPPQSTPLGPSLLSCQFHHGHILPISRPLHSSPSSLTATGPQGIVPTISVPTPVSPPAMLGEKLKSWEAAAGLLAREIVENSLWAESWQPNNHHTCRTASSIRSTCQSAASQLATALGTLEDSHTSLRMDTLFDLAAGSPHPHQGDASSSLQIMEPPYFSVKKGNNVVNVLPSAIRFWEKAGLHPLGGQKDVNAFVLYEDERVEMFEHTSRWFKRVSAAYVSRNFGSHEPGCLKDGSSPASVIGVRFDSIRRFLSTFTPKIEVSEYLVFYIITPRSMMTLTSSNFRQTLSAAKRALKGSPAMSTLFQFVPESMVVDPASEDQRTMSTFVTSVYDRLLKPVSRGMPRPPFAQEESVGALVQSPAFTLSRPQRPRPTFLRQAPARSLDVMDRDLLLHVGYSKSSCGKWVIASCIDQRGSNHDLGLWLNQPDDEIPEEFVVNKVWEFAMSFTKRTDVEWRVAFSKVGSIEEREMEAWHSKVSLGISIQGTSPIHISVLSVTSDAPWTLLPVPARPSGLSGLAKAAPSTKFQEVSSITYALIHTIPVTIFSPLPVDSPIVAETAVSESDGVVVPGIGIRPLSTAILVRAPADTDCASVSMLRVDLLLTLKSAGSHLHISDEDTHLDIVHNFHELTVMGNTRWNLGARANPILPFHLSCLEVMDRVLVDEVQID